MAKTLCIQPYLDGKFITDHGYELKDGQIMPRALLEWVKKECIHKNTVKVPYLPLCKWEKWNAYNFANKSCYFVYDQNVLRQASEPKKQLKSTLLIRSLVEGEAPSEFEPFNEERVLRNGVVLVFKVPNSLQGDRFQRDLQFIVRIINKEADSNYASLLISQDYGASRNSNTLVVEQTTRELDASYNDSANDKVSSVVEDQARKDNDCLTATKSSREVNTTPLLKKKAWNIFVNCADVDQREDLEQTVVSLGGNVMKIFKESQYSIVPNNIKTFEQFGQALGVVLTDDLSLEEYIKRCGTRLLDPKWLHDCSLRQSFFDPGPKYSHIFEPSSSRKQNKRLLLEPIGLTPMNRSTPQPVQSVPVETVQNLVSRQLLDSFTTVHGTTGDRRKSAPITKMCNVSSVLRSESDEDPSAQSGSNAPLLAVIKFKEKLNEEMVEDLRCELDATKSENEELINELKEKNDALNLFGYHLHDTQTADSMVNIDDEKRAL